MILEKYFQARIVCETLDVYFYALPSEHNWYPYFG